MQNKILNESILNEDSDEVTSNQMDLVDKENEKTEAIQEDDTDENMKAIDKIKSNEK